MQRFNISSKLLHIWMNKGRKKNSGLTCRIIFPKPSIWSNFTFFLFHQAHLFFKITFDTAIVRKSCEILLKYTHQSSRNKVANFQISSKLNNFQNNIKYSRRTLCATIHHTQSASAYYRSTNLIRIHLIERVMQKLFDFLCGKFSFRKNFSRGNFQCSSSMKLSETIQLF